MIISAKDVRNKANELIQTNKEKQLEDIAKQINSNLTEGYIEYYPSLVKGVDTILLEKGYILEKKHNIMDGDFVKISW